MGYLFSHYFKPLLLFILIICPFAVILVYRTDYAITLKGDTQKFESVVEIDTKNEEKGSFSTIFVINMEHSTAFQVIQLIFQQLNHIMLLRYSIILQLRHQLF